MTETKYLGIPLWFVLLAVPLAGLVSVYRFVASGFTGTSGDRSEGFEEVDDGDD